MLTLQSDLGVLPVLPTPFAADGEKIEFEALRSHIRFLLEAGVSGMVALGGTSEAVSLRSDEWALVAETVLEEVGGTVPVVVGALANATRDALELAKRAEQLGADGVMITHPFYSLPRAIELKTHYSVIADALSIPLVIYNNPATTGVDLYPDDLAELASHPNIAFVKESSGELGRISKIRELAGDTLTVLCGREDMAFESFVLGARGWISAGANVLPEAAARLYRLVAEEKDYAGAVAVAERMRPVMAFLEESGMFVQLVKAGVRLRGGDCGEPRLPLLPAGPAEIERMRALLSAAEAELVGAEV
jgi:4-hydroxy-tetrahydrodipicolinate synthase